LLCSRYSFLFSLNNWYMLNQIFRLFNNMNNILYINYFAYI
jgi:hypothetical protein